MSAKSITVATLVLAAATLVSTAAAGSSVTRQRVAITAKGGIHGFVLTPREAGVVTGDSGTATFCCWSERVVRRDGQRIEINDPLMLLVGKQGRLKIRFRIEWIDAGNGYVVGTGTWKVVRGTGAYKGLTGSGRSAHAWLPNGPVSWLAEGFLGPERKTASVATRAAAPVTATADREKASLQRYLSAMSWPVRASLLRARSVSSGIEGFIFPGDTPILGGIANSCRNLRAVEVRGRLLSITAPERLQSSHRTLVRTYSAAREGCKKASGVARALVRARYRFYETRSAANKTALAASRQGCAHVAPAVRARRTEAVRPGGRQLALGSAPVHADSRSAAA